MVQMAETIIAFLQKFNAENSFTFKFKIELVQAEK